jgi:hypothetical protein
VLEIFEAIAGVAGTMKIAEGDGRCDNSCFGGAPEHGRADGEGDRIGVQTGKMAQLPATIAEGLGEVIEEKLEEL